MNVLWVLQDLAVDNGIASLLINFYKFKPLCIKVDFLIVDKSKQYFKTDIAMDSNIYSLPVSSNKFHFSNFIYLRKIIQKGKYDYIHLNINSVNAVIISLLCKKNRIKLIYHAHNPKENTNLKAIIRQFLFENTIAKMADIRVACSNISGNSVFGNRKFVLIHNAVDYKRFYFNFDARTSTRNLLNISNETIVIGVVARFADQKNPFFIIDIFKECLKFNRFMQLLWIGEGPLKNDVIEYAKEKDVYDKCRFLNSVANVQDYYCAMDCFLLPSKFEGFGLVVLEAQISGLMVFCSTNVSNEVNISNKFIRINVEKGANYWASKIIDGVKRLDRNEIFVKNIYDLNVCSKKFWNLYDIQ